MIRINQYDIVVIGGGCAGMAAAIKASENGASVLILERDRELGGILKQCIHEGFGVRYFKELLTGPEFAARLKGRVIEAQSTKATNAQMHKIPESQSAIAAEKFRNLEFKIKNSDTQRLDILIGTMVISFGILPSETDGVLPIKEITAINKDQGLIKIHARAIILAMGCRERTRGAINIPGSRPAGIYPAGLAQRLINIEGYMVGKRVVILGSGDIGLIMARRLTIEGAKVLCVAEVQSSLTGLQRNKVLCLDDFNIPLFTSHTVKAIHGEKRVESVELVQVDEKWNYIHGTEKKYDCDTVLIAVGLIPENELSRKAGVKLSKNGGAVINEFFETNLSGVFSAGNVLQVHDLVDWAVLEGETVGNLAAKYLKNLLGNKNKSPLSVVAGQNINYIKPDIIEYLGANGLIKFSFRVQRPMKNVKLILTSNGKEIMNKTKPGIIPGEMEFWEVSLRKDQLGDELKLDVTPI
jgi:pyruvate/2-oxoglutarate dehydrogenase complex dihydrolipoamide dehydrogenase (E3) component